MIQVLLMGLATLVFIGAVLVNRGKLIDEKKTATVEPSGVVIIEELPTTVTPYPSPIPTTITAKDELPDMKTDESKFFLVYPGSRLVKEADGKAVYETGIEASTVGKWYKQMLDDQQFGIRNYVSTSTNGHVSVSITFIADDRKVRVMVDQDPGKLTYIEVELQ